MAPEPRVSVLLDALSDKTSSARLPPTCMASRPTPERVPERGGLLRRGAGFKQDARRFIPDAVARGAGLVGRKARPVPVVTVPQVLVPATRPALARLAAAYHGHPSRSLTLVGITGTNGKTTSSYLVDALLRGAGPTGILGTIQYVVGDEIRPAGQTTPEALELQAMLATMRERGVKGVPWRYRACARALQGRAWPRRRRLHEPEQDHPISTAARRYGRANAAFELSRVAEAHAERRSERRDPWGRRMGRAPSTLELRPGAGNRVRDAGGASSRARIASRRPAAGWRSSRR